MPLDKRIRIQRISARFQQARLSLGFMDQPNVAETIDLCRHKGLHCDRASTTFFLGRETLLVNRASPMALWRQRLFIGLSRLASSRADYFGMPPNQVVELGVQLSL